MARVRRGRVVEAEWQPVFEESLGVAADHSAGGEKRI